MAFNAMRKTMPMMLICWALISSHSAMCEPPPTGARKDLYDKTANGEKQISDALVMAQRANKSVLIQFGANWCGWCHKLHNLFEKDSKIAKALLYNYEVVLIDVDTVGGKKHNASIDERYGNPTQHGLPVLVVLDADGKLLVTQETGALEDGDHHDAAKVLAFLEKWKPAPMSANDVLTKALGQAKSQSKKAFVYFGAPWCRWCHRWDEYLHRSDIANIFKGAYVPVKIDVDRMTHGKEVQARLCGDDKGGIPSFVVLRPDGTKLADSVGTAGNIGFPVDPHEIAHFMEVVEQTTALTDKQRAVLKKGLARPKK